LPKRFSPAIQLDALASLPAGRARGGQPTAADEHPGPLERDRHREEKLIGDGRDEAAVVRPVARVNPATAADRAT